MKKNITYSDIAKYTNLSKATISRYFNSQESLTEETTLIIEKALKELNYKENKKKKIKKFAQRFSKILKKKPLLLQQRLYKY